MTSLSSTTNSLPRNSATGGSTADKSSNRPPRSHPRYFWKTSPDERSRPPSRTGQAQYSLPRLRHGPTSSRQRGGGAMQRTLVRLNSARPARWSALRSPRWKRELESVIQHRGLATQTSHDRSRANLCDRRLHQCEVIATEQAYQLRHPLGQTLRHTRPTSRRCHSPVAQPLGIPPI